MVQTDVPGFTYEARDANGVTVGGGVVFSSDADAAAALAAGWHHELAISIIREASSDDALLPRA